MWSEIQKNNSIFKTIYRCWKDGAKNCAKKQEIHWNICNWRNNLTNQSIDQSSTSFNSGQSTVESINQSINRPKDKYGERGDSLQFGSSRIDRIRVMLSPDSISSFYCWYCITCLPHKRKTPVEITFLDFQGWSGHSCPSLTRHTGKQRQGQPGSTLFWVRISCPRDNISYFNGKNNETTTVNQNQNKKETISRSGTAFLFPLPRRTICCGTASWPFLRPIKKSINDSSTVSSKPTVGNCECHPNCCLSKCNYLLK